MLPSAPGSLGPHQLQAEFATPRRIRHITSIQLRNVTPFPARDAFTSALKQPSEQHPFGATGTVDDVGTLLSRRRTRKLSAASIATRRSLKWDEDTAEKPGAASFSETPIPTSGSVHFAPNVSGRQSLSSSRSGQSTRGRRARTSSIASSGSNHLAQLFQPDTPSTILHSLIPDNSQAALEKVIRSRLIETFIAISLPFHDRGIAATVPEDSSLRSAPLQKVAATQAAPRPQRTGSLSLKASRDIAASSSPHRRNPSTPSSAPPTNTSFRNANNVRADTKPKGAPNSRLNGAAHSMSTSYNNGMSESDISDSSSPHPTSNFGSPIYFSPIHQPSTNPSFPIDVKASKGFPAWVDTSGHKLKVEAWGKLPSSERTSLLTTLNDKPSALNTNPLDENDYEWKLLDCWELDLNELISLSADIDTRSSQLPTNAILLTLDPPGKSLYFVPPSGPLDRSPSPSGYASDPELPSTSKTTQPKTLSWDDLETQSPKPIDGLPISRRRRHASTPKSATVGDMATTATWQKLFELVSLQTCLLDNRVVLNEVIGKIDGLLEQDKAIPLQRDISEREACVRSLHANRGIVIDQIAERRLEIAERSRRLKERRELLLHAQEEMDFNPEIERKADDSRIQLTALRTNITSLRTSLVSALSSIFPIELFSSPDLLYTVLDVPLPIPLNSNDPAPPLSMDNHKEVTEESVATALGFVAQVIQILAAYLGENLVYPVTCIGSRSLIRDGISMMVGPRMFPLYSKGVDTYRFEYGVFLLNKNIEILMSERDLRALDIRHTLPNLKNLLLTLTYNSPVYQVPRGHSSPVSSISGLETPSREPSPTNDDIQTPKASYSTTLHVSSRITPTASGATTPTAPSLSDSKAKSFLGFAPLDFIRSRYPSSIHTPEKAHAKPTTNETESDHGGSSDTDPTSDDGPEDDEEDRKTIHGVVPSEGQTATQTVAVGASKTKET
ncbi:hypothetical protein D9619_003097 [Psilocybe cf. subviscida]|uniref:Autophagy-related protein 14 n=1 Tax=Psilocybe cf. subviscida TaxID=2480587 RepID=A0A8H5AXG4_9AGAR|nr:hypothetical protein D9619_003097 [Psilocybe cf. subviscida]